MVSINIKIMLSRDIDVKIVIDLFSREVKVHSKV